MTDLFYIKPCEDSVVSPSDLEKPYECVFWRPTWFSIAPPGLRIARFLVWWLFHRLRIFSNHDYGVLLVYCDKELIHRSCVFPGFFRFPFMKEQDLQIGDTWTAVEHRRRGIAAFAIKKIFEVCRRPGRQFWYVVEEENLPSIKAVEKAGFLLAGKGGRVNRFGMRLFGKYEILSPSSKPSDIVP
jgi:RimJ/RimL family protein N-acetyltransferase